MRVGEAVTSELRSGGEKKVIGRDESGDVTIEIAYIDDMETIAEGLARIAGADRV